MVTSLYVKTSFAHWHFSLVWKKLCREGKLHIFSYEMKTFWVCQEKSVHADSMKTLFGGKYYRFAFLRNNEIFLQSWVVNISFEHCYKNVFMKYVSSLDSSWKHFFNVVKVILLIVLISFQYVLLFWAVFTEYYFYYVFLLNMHNLSSLYRRSKNVSKTVCMPWACQSLKVP